ncbi:MAG: hypothetical protein ACTFAK_10395 [Candidatus Electronema sp. VV]
MCDDFLYHHNVLTHHFLFYHYHLSIYHQRLQATAKCMEGLYDTARRIRCRSLPGD